MTSCSCYSRHADVTKEELETNFMLKRGQALGFEKNEQIIDDIDSENSSVVEEVNEIDETEIKRNHCNSHGNDQHIMESIPNQLTQHPPGPYMYCYQPDMNMSPDQLMMYTSAYQGYPYYPQMDYSPYALYQYYINSTAKNQSDANDQQGGGEKKEKEK